MDQDRSDEDTLIIMDLIWSDPSQFEGFNDNDNRGDDICEFGSDVLLEFLQKN